MPICGFGFHERDVPPGSVELAQALGPYYLFCIEHFGAERCMFESNFPVDRASCYYGVLWNAFKRIACRFLGRGTRCAVSRYRGAGIPPLGAC